jgi:hypothetical protein
MYDRRLAVLAAAALTVPAAACDDPAPTDIDVVVMGSVSAVVHDSVAVLPAGETDPIPADTMTYGGLFTGSTQVELYSDTDGWTSLGAASDAEFLMYCWQAAVPFADVSVPADTYSRVRLTLSGFEANVNAGAIIHGVAYADPISITLGIGGAAVVIEKNVTPFTITADNDLSVIFDLNSELWLDAGTVLARAVAAAEVAAATNVFVR